MPSRQAHSVSIRCAVLSVVPELTLPAMEGWRIAVEFASYPYWELTESRPCLADYRNHNLPQSRLIIIRSENQEDHCFTLKGKSCDLPTGAAISCLEGED